MIFAMETLQHLLAEILDETKLETFRNREREGGRLHPLTDLLKTTEENSQLHSNVFTSLKTCMQKNLRWVKSKALELASEDVTSASACVAEISVYGALLRSSLDVEPISVAKQKTPDFLVKLADKEVIIEVNAKQYNNATVDELKAFHKEEDWMGDEPGVYVRSHPVVPFGVPKIGESTTENAISKITSTKQDEGQTDENKPCVLWLDFQDPIWSLVIRPSQALPLQYGQESFQSGEFWYAFYGYKGIPIFENYSVEIFEQPIRMKHHGKFRNGSKFSACIVNTRHGLFLLENPWSFNPLPDVFTEKMLDMQGFNFVCSWLNWPDGRLRQRIKNEYIILASLEAYGRGTR